MVHKDTNEYHIENDPFHQHPHEGDQEEVVYENSSDLAVDGDHITFRVGSVCAGHKDEMAYAQIDA